MAKKLQRNASSGAYLRQGKEQEIRFNRLPECTPLAGPVIDAANLLRAGRDKRVACEEAFIPIRVTCDFADREWDQVLRAAASGAESVTGGRKSQAWRELFPNGTKALVAYAGATQKAAADQFLIHLASCTTPGAVTVREEWSPKLTKARDVLGAALEARAAGDRALFVARAEEQAAKRDFRRTMDKVIAQVRAIYPEDRAAQDLAFPSIEESASAAKDEGEDEEIPVVAPETN